MSLFDFRRGVPVAAAREIRGARTLPSGFDHPHASEEARVVAERGLILRVHQPDRAWVNAWLHRSHLDYWATQDS
jgi:hypothetical protein